MWFFLASGVANLVRRAVQHSVNRLIFRQTYYDSDVFRYTQLSKRSAGGLYKGKYQIFICVRFKDFIMIILGESCRLQASICSFDEHCCSGRCLCRRWAVTGEQRCVRKCF